MRANYETGVTCLYMCIMTQLVNNVYCTNRCARKKEFIRTVSDTTATPIMILQSSTVADSGYSCDVGAAGAASPLHGGAVPARAFSRPGGRRGISLALNELPCSCA